MPAAPSPSRTPSRDKALPFLPQALAEGWSVARLAKEAGVGRHTAHHLLREGSKRSADSIGSELDREGNRAVVVARQVRDGQIEQASRMEALTEKALKALEDKAAKGELNVRDLETLVKLREKHWAHVKELSGLGFAEKMHLAQAKGEATGKGFAGALLDSTTVDLGDGVFEIVTDR